MANIKYYGSVDFKYFIRHCEDEGRFIYTDPHRGVIPFRHIIWDDGDDGFSWSGSNVEWASRVVFRHWLDENSRLWPCAGGGTVIRVADNPMSACRENTSAIQARVQICRDILGDKKWDALSMEDKAAATMFIQTYGVDDARKEWRYVGEPRLETFINDREFYALGGVTRLSECVKEVMEDTGDTELILSDVAENFREYAIFDYDSYAYDLSVKCEIEWNYIELYDETRDDDSNDFRGIVYWSSKQNNN